MSNLFQRYVIHGPKRPGPVLLLYSYRKQSARTLLIIADGFRYAHHVKVIAEVYPTEIIVPRVELELARLRAKYLEDIERSGVPSRPNYRSNEGRRLKSNHDLKFKPSRHNCVLRNDPINCVLSRVTLLMNKLKRSDQHSHSRSWINR